MALVQAIDSFTPPSLTRISLVAVKESAKQWLMVINMVRFSLHEGFRTSELILLFWLQTSVKERFKLALLPGQ